MTVTQSVFVVGRAGELSRMRPASPPSEYALQELLERYPELIGDSDGPLLLIRREQPIADSDLSSGRWSIDHLFVTREAVPVLVEVKRAANTQLRREVVGQMMDYAANSVAYWPAGTVGQMFAETCAKLEEDPDIKLAEFLGDADPEAFWAQVDANFRAARLKLVFVADVIPRELARIVEFLNEQMSIVVHAVELRYFEGENGERTLVPHVIGQTERAAANKTIDSFPKAASVEEWIDQRIKPHGEVVLSSFERLRNILERCGFEIRLIGGKQSYVNAVYMIPNRKEYLLYSINEKINLSFGSLRQGLSEEMLKKFYDKFDDIFGPLSHRNHLAYPNFPIEKLNKEGATQAFEDITKEWIDAISEA